jgi:hypothetical protein
MEQETRQQQNEIQHAHRLRAVTEHEPLYGLAPEPGAGGPESTGDSEQPRMEVPVEEPEAPGEDTTNLTWGIVFGGVLILFVLAAVLFFGIGNTYSSAPFTTYPLK